MTPTEVLTNEHGVILVVIEAAEQEAGSIRKTGRVNADSVTKMIDFFRNFVDRCHHAKEEKQLFRKMEERGVRSDTGPIAVMLQEHDMGRQHIKAVSDALPRARAGDKGAIEIVERSLSAYAVLLRAHISKEDNVLYPFADNVLTEKDKERLLKAFDDVEKKEMGEGEHERFHQIAHELSERK